MTYNVAIGERLKLAKQADMAAPDMSEETRSGGADATSGENWRQTRDKWRICAQKTTALLITHRPPNICYCNRVI